MASVRDILRYELLGVDDDGHVEPVAEHGMGKVYKAYDLLRDEEVALKIVRDAVLRKQKGRAKRAFLAEAMAGARLAKQCPHIVKVHDIGQLDDIIYMGQEWVPGGNIDELGGQVTIYRAKSIIRQIGNAVRVAHANEIVHSDIAPTNILYDSRRDLYKLSDFGLLKLMSKTSLSSSGSTSLLTGGRRDYMPREHADNPERINYSTDVYALAVTFYRLLTGDLPPRVDGGYGVPGIVRIPGDSNRQAPYAVCRLVNDFVVAHKDDHRIDLFLKELAEIPS